jgi:hypothetical protein
MLACCLVVSLQLKGYWIMVIIDIAQLGLGS